MKKAMLLTVVLFLVPAFAFGQFVINDFDAVPDTNYWSSYDLTVEGTYIETSLETENVHGGDGALRIDWQNRA